MEDVKVMEDEIKGQEEKREEVEKKGKYEY